MINNSKVKKRLCTRVCVGECYALQRVQPLEDSFSLKVLEGRRKFRAASAKLISVFVLQVEWSSKGTKRENTFSII